MAPTSSGIYNSDYKEDGKANLSDLPADIGATNGVVRSTRDLLPAHYIFQIKNFSLLFKNEVKKCESGQFEAGDYQWRLGVQVLHTDGKKNIYCNHGNDPISLYLAIANQNNLLPS
ncbi:uncharacterized protein LOC121239173 [Juglans microcarpa x Juglans regia]|uniref:uncharacterized protein LOC121239173 n=1 Tax=Juglans microcarpa x Juglans regia TaxID=2249226 RepID=UPI001B7EFD74|nr:uncharacterized protein LOC121239173 [Juglans microcarpa x Juglans regia]